MQLGGQDRQKLIPEKGEAIYLIFNHCEDQ
jgi:hypothetical protein